MSEIFLTHIFAYNCGDIGFKCGFLGELYLLALNSNFQLLYFLFRYKFIFQFILHLPWNRADFAKAGWWGIVEMFTRRDEDVLISQIWFGIEFTFPVSWNCIVCGMWK